MVENEGLLEELETQMKYEIGLVANNLMMGLQDANASVIKTESKNETDILESLTLSKPPLPLQIESTTSTPKRVRGAIVDDDCAIETPDGWRRQVVQRQGGLSAGKCDVYYFSPLGKKLRSRKEVQTYCEMHNLDVNLDLFRFTRVSMTTPKVPKSKQIPTTAKSPKTPKVIQSKVKLGQPKVKLGQPKIKVDQPKTKLILSKAKKITSPRPKGLDAVKKKPKAKAARDGTLKISHDVVIRRRKKSVWVPPKSPFSLFQESLFQNPWKLLIGTIFMNRASSDDVSGSRLLWDFFKTWSTPESAKSADPETLAEFLSSLPQNEKQANMIIKFSEEYLSKSWTYPKELHGIGKYGNDSYRIFCVNEWRKVRPTDFLLNFYVDWLWDNHTVLGLD